jgi:hypothetical protein
MPIGRSWFDRPKSHAGLALFSPHEPAAPRYVTGKHQQKLRRQFDRGIKQDSSAGVRHVAHDAILPRRPLVWGHGGAALHAASHRLPLISRHDLSSGTQIRAAYLTMHSLMLAIEYRGCEGGEKVSYASARLFGPRK